MNIATMPSGPPAENVAAQSPSDALARIADELARQPDLQELHRACLDLLALSQRAPLHAMAAFARQLGRAGRIESAQTLWHALRDTHPASPAGWVGLATLATQQQRWPDAMEAWNEALRRFPDRHQPVWKLGLARAMHRLGLDAEATVFLEQALASNPGASGVLQLLVTLLEKTGRLADALAVIDAHREQCLGQVPLQFEYLKLLTRRGRQAEAAEIAERLLADATSLDPFPGVVRMLPELSTKGRRAELARLASEGLQRLPSAALSTVQQQIANELRLRLALLRDRRDTFSELFASLAPDDLPPRLHEAYAQHAQQLSRPVSSLLSAPKVFCIGLSKTATTSLTSALSLLGLRAAHYQNPLTFELLDAQEAMYFDASADTPISHVFESLYFAYPGARFIYTVRPRDSWLDSLRSHHRQHFGTSDWTELRTLTSRQVSPAAQIEAALYFHHPDARAAWDAHDRRVRHFFADKPRERFLELDVFSGQGWPQLCRFLQLPVPSVRFPHENPIRDRG